MSPEKTQRFANAVWSLVGIAALALGLLPAILTLFMGGEDMRALTFDDWKAGGYRVKRGAKAIAFNPRTGEALFSRDQVTEETEYEKRKTNGEEE